MREKLPGVVLDLRGELLTPAQVERLLDGTLDLGFRSVLHDAVEDACAAHGFKPLAAHEVAETATLVSFVAAGLGVSLVPVSVCKMTVEGAVYRPLAEDATRVELAAAWRATTTAQCSDGHST